MPLSALAGCSDIPIKKFMSIQNPPVKKEEPAKHPTAEGFPAVAAAAEDSPAEAEGSSAAAEGSSVAAEGNPVAAEDSPVVAEGSSAAAEDSPAAAYIVNIAERQEAW